MPIQNVTETTAMADEIGIEKDTVGDDSPRHPMPKTTGVTPAMDTRMYPQVLAQTVVKTLLMPERRRLQCPLLQYPVQQIILRQSLRVPMFLP